MVKTIIGGIDVQEYITRYSISSPPIMNDNAFRSANDEYVTGITGSEVTLKITLEAVPTPVSMKLAEVMNEANFIVDYTTPVPRRNKFHKVLYDAECEDADPDNENYNVTDGILWNIKLSLRSVESNTSGGGL